MNAKNLLLLFTFFIFLPISVFADEPHKLNFSPAVSCKGCHSRIFEQYNESMHKKSFENPLFMAQLAKEILPEMEKNGSTSKETKGCVTCHAPVRMLTKGVPKVSELKPGDEGITCDLCHTMTGMDDNMNIISDTDGKKLGPLNLDNWHSKYSKYITTSAFCATCHNDYNRNNVPIKSTYSEWLRSKYAANKIECQDCHMNSKGYLDASGKAQYETGKAVYFSALGNQDALKHEKLYSHRFPGAHSKSQSESAFKLRLMGINSECTPDVPYTFALYVDNSKAGHSMPTGSTDLRRLWLEVFIHTEKGDVFVPMPSHSKEGYDVVGKNGADKLLIGGDIPKGARIYRTVFGDKDGKPTQSAFDSFSILYDNRLKESEKRIEQFQVRFPGGIDGKVHLVANLKYLSYPSSMAARLGVEPPKVTILATIDKEITLAPISKNKALK